VVPISFPFNLDNEIQYILWLIGNTQPIGLDKFFPIAFPFSLDNGPDCLHCFKRCLFNKIDKFMLYFNEFVYFF